MLWFSKSPCGVEVHRILLTTMFKKNPKQNRTNIFALINDHMTKCNQIYLWPNLAAILRCTELVLVSHWFDFIACNFTILFESHGSRIPRRVNSSPVNVANCCVKRLLQDWLETKNRGKSLLAVFVFFSFGHNCYNSVATALNMPLTLTTTLSIEPSCLLRVQPF